GRESRDHAPVERIHGERAPTCRESKNIPCSDEHQDCRNNRCHKQPVSSGFDWILELLLENCDGQTHESCDNAQRPDYPGHCNVIRIDYSIEYYDENNQIDHDAFEVVERK